MVNLSNHVAISLRLNTRQQTTIATSSRLPPPHQVRGRNDKPPHPKILSIPFIQVKTHPTPLILSPSKAPSPLMGEGWGEGAHLSLEEAQP